MEYLMGVWSSLEEYPYIQALFIISLSILGARLAEWIMTRALRRITRSTATHLDDRILDLLQAPVFYSLLLAGLAVSLQRLELPPGLGPLLSNLIKTLAVALWLVFGVRISLMLLTWMTSHPDRFHVVQPATQPLFDIAFKVLLIGGALYFVMISWGIDVSAWLASAGILGLAVGFAAKDTLANLFAGVFILADAPYKIGDVVVLDQGERGRVTKIGMRSTRILTRDDIEITVPNAAIANSKIVNESGGPHVRHRVRLSVGVAYGSDLDQVREVLLAVAREGVAEGHLAADPEPRVRFREFGDSSLRLELLFWIEDPETRGLVQDWCNTKIYKALRREGIEIPYPKRDLYVRQMPGGREGAD